MSRIIRSKTLPPGEYKAKVVAVVKKPGELEVEVQLDAPGKPTLSHFLRRAPARRGR